MALDLHNVLVGVGGLEDQDVSRSSADGNKIIALLVPGKLTNACLRYTGAFILGNGLLAVKPAFVLETQLEDLDGWVNQEVHSRPPEAKWVQLLLKSMEETLLGILQP